MTPETAAALTALTRAATAPAVPTVTVTPLPRTAAVNRAYGPGGTPLWVVRVSGTGPGAGTFVVAARDAAAARRLARA